MIYALNLFNLVQGKEETYRDYSVKAGKMIYQLGGRVLASGYRPICHLQGEAERRNFIIVEFPSKEVFEKFHRQADEAGLHSLREKSTCDYIWTLFEPWDLREWVRSS